MSLTHRPVKFLQTQYRKYFCAWWCLNKNERDDSKNSPHPITSGTPHSRPVGKADGVLTLSVGEVEEQTQDEQQRQQQRGSGSAHGGTAWHQHALAASVALAHRALWVSLVWFLRCRVFTAYARQGGKGRGRRKEGMRRGEKRREKERGEWLKQSCLAPRVLSIPAHFWHTPTQPRLELTEDRKSLMCSQGMFWQFSKWNSHFTQRVCTCAWEGVRRRVQATEREREKPPRWKGELIWFCLHSSGHERQLNALHNMSTFQVHLRSAAISVSH